MGTQDPTATDSQPVSQMVLAECPTHRTPADHVRNPLRDSNLSSEIPSKLGDILPTKNARIVV